MTRHFKEFVEIGPFLDLCRPATQAGKTRLAALEPTACAAQLEAEYDRIERCVQLIEADPIAVRQLEACLRRVPELAHRSGETDEERLFKVKRFLYNISKIDELLDGEIFPEPQLEFNSDPLLNALSLDGSAQTFHLSSRYSPDLAAVRDRIANLRGELMRVFNAAIAPIEAQLGTRFGGREFLIVEDMALVEAISPLVQCEPYGPAGVLIKPRLPQDYFTVQRRLHRELELEQSLQHAICTDLLERVSAEMDRIERYREWMIHFDLALAKAQLVKRCGLVRPRLVATGEAIAVEQGRLWPLEQRCRDQQRHYEPLTLRLKERIAVLTGANMGGKTAVLQTVGFLQLAAQLGFFVPAEQFKTIPFAAFYCPGESRSSNRGGLSSFAEEIVLFNDAYTDPARPVLWLMDEMLRTTTHLEGSALLRAMLTALNSRRGIYALWATHLNGLGRSTGVASLRMAGLLARTGGPHDAASEIALENRIARINRQMIYKVVKDDGSRRDSDGLHIAAELGLDPQILNTAKSHLRGTDET